MENPMTTVLLPVEQHHLDDFSLFQVREGVELAEALNQTISLLSAAIKILSRSEDANLEIFGAVNLIEMAQALVESASRGLPSSNP